jgi:hypothetical protein
MAFSEFESTRIEKVVGSYVERIRPPPHIRPELDIGFRISGQSVEIIEIRPCFGNEKEFLQHPVAKATFVKTRNVWKVFWRRADLNWHPYPPKLQVKTIDAFITLVEEDALHCFWG